MLLLLPTVEVTVQELCKNVGGMELHMDNPICQLLHKRGECTATAVELKAAPADMPCQLDIRLDKLGFVAERKPLLQLCKSLWRGKVGFAIAPAQAE
eukprot:CAMPEP_0179069064 /NCGR_PEP_ID=MMETSP0796-20121207/30317_1 /TAXON_ID=73915 /ORGANISM="Pyrodinium bahamense, Strain pbaha01" /LENGTH=96 /DNA_ID=CAMNT_0020766123 /DNA_START=782 /DNA_END=1072 /DNA_ORIENTATION=+